MNLIILISLITNLSCLKTIISILIYLSLVFLDSLFRFIAKFSVETFIRQKICTFEKWSFASFWTDFIFITVFRFILVILTVDNWLIVFKSLIISLLFNFTFTHNFRIKTVFRLNGLQDFCMLIIFILKKSVVIKKSFHNIFSMLRIYYFVFLVVTFMFYFVNEISIVHMIC